MTSRQLASACGVSLRQIFKLKARFPADAPASFSDLDGWRAFIERCRANAAVKSQPSPTDRGELSDNQRYLRARADRTESLAAAERIRLEASRRDLLPRLEVETVFAAVANRVKARLRRLVNDAPSQLLGLNSHEIHKVLGAQIEQALNEIAMPGDFYEPSKI